MEDNNTADLTIVASEDASFNIEEAINVGGINESEPNILEELNIHTPTGIIRSNKCAININIQIFHFQFKNILAELFPQKITLLKNVAWNQYMTK